MPRRPALPKDPSQRAKAILDMATGDRAEYTVEGTEAQILGRRGGLKGGKARAEALSAKRRKEIAKRAAESRWAGRKKEDR